MYKYGYIRNFYKYIRFLGKCEGFVAFFLFFCSFFAFGFGQTCEYADYLFSIFLPFTMYIPGSVMLSSFSPLRL